MHCTKVMKYDFTVLEDVTSSIIIRRVSRVLRACRLVRKLLLLTQILKSYLFDTAFASTRIILVYKLFKNCKNCIKDDRIIVMNNQSKLFKYNQCNY